MRCPQTLHTGRFMMHMMWWLNRLYGMGSLLAVMVVILRAGSALAFLPLSSGAFMPPDPTRSDAEQDHKMQFPEWPNDVDGDGTIDVVVRHGSSSRKAENRCSPSRQPRASAAPRSRWRVSRLEGHISNPTTRIPATIRHSFTRTCTSPRAIIISFGRRLRGDRVGRHLAPAW